MSSEFIAGLVLIIILALFMGMSMLASRKNPLPSVCAGPDDCSECAQNGNCQSQKQP
jgi:hypothetical protein